jgi:hypothetical protein
MDRLASMTVGREEIVPGSLGRAVLTLEDAKDLR